MFGVFRGHGPATTHNGTTRGGFNLFRVFRRLVIFIFAFIQLVLVSRILLDLEIIPMDWAISDSIIRYSDSLAAPVQGIGNVFGVFESASAMIPGMDAIAGQGFNPVMLAALAGWTAIEPLVLRVVRKFESVAHD